mgnify:CR=1 FL=1
MQRAAKLTSNELSVYQSPEGMVEVLRPSFPVYCVRPAKIRKIAKTFLEGFPGDVLYAVKCNSEPHMLQELYQAGIRHFDTASLPEISLVSEMFGDGQAYFMHPVKSRAAISSAHQVYGVRYYVVDHPSELEKISELIPADPEVVIVVRIAVQNSGAVYELSSKFGASVHMAVDLAKSAIRRGYSYGFAFHIGSHVPDEASELEGQMTVNMQFQHDRCATLLLSDQAGWTRETLMISSNHTTVVNDGDTTIATLIADCINKSTEESGIQTVADAPRILALCESARLSCLTGSIEQPYKVLEMFSS